MQADRLHSTRLRLSLCSWLAWVYVLEGVPWRLIGRRDVGVTSEVERRLRVEASTSRRRKQASGSRRQEAGVRKQASGSRRRSGGRGQASGKRRRNGQPADDIRVRILRWGDKDSLEMTSGKKLC